MPEQSPTPPAPTSTITARRAAVISAALLALALGACGRSGNDAAPEGATADPAPLTTYGPLASLAEDQEWNPGAIAWQPYEAGLKRAKAENKPVCLVFFANWCPHCHNYSKVFNDPKIVQKSRDFVMIRVNADDDMDISRRYARDGTYVPRTYFLAPDGTIKAEVHAPRPQYVYFYDEHNPASLLAGMDAALASR